MKNRKFSWLVYCLVSIMAIGAIVALAGCPDINTTTTDDDDEYTITIASGILNGTLSVPNNKATSRTQITVTVKPATGYVLVPNSLKYNNKTITPTSRGVYRFPMPEENVSITALFVDNSGPSGDPSATYNVEVDVEGGSLTVSPTSGKQGTLIKVTTVEPENGKKYVPGSLTYSPGIPINDTTREFNLPARNVTVTALFVDASENIDTSYTVDIDSPFENGTVSASPLSGKVGTTITVTATPTKGYQLKAGSLKYTTTDNVVVVINTTQKFILPLSNVTITAEFEIESVATNEGYGVPDPAWMAKYPYLVFPDIGPNEILTEGKMPPASYWNTQETEAGLIGHIHTYPDPFHFANGNRVVTLADWENRKKELQLIISWYGKGRVPAIDSDTVDIWLSGANNTTINIRHKGNGNTQSFSISVTNNTSLTVPGNEGKLYASSGNSSIGQANTDRKTLNTGSHSVLARSAIATLYGMPAGEITRDSAHGWNGSVALTAIQGTDDPTTRDGDRQATVQYFYPTPDGSSSWFTDKGPFVSSGYSTNGKEAYAHVLAVGRKGGNFGFADVGDSGCCGAAIERFVGYAGLRNDVTVAEALSYSGYTRAQVEALGLDPDLTNPITSGSTKYGWPVPIAPLKHQGASTRTTDGSLGGFADLWGAPYYTYGLQSGRTWEVAAPGDSVVNIANTGTGNFRAVRGWAPYWEDFDRAPTGSGATNFGTAPTGNWANAKIPFVAYQTPGENWSGIQNWIQSRGEQGNSRDWQGDTWRLFSDLHAGLDIDHAAGQSGRGTEGFACTMPFDTYFIAMLNAPHGTTYIRSGASAQIRTNQPSMEAAWLIADEIYKFYGEQEYAAANGGVLVEDPAYPGSGLKMGWDTYIWNNGCFFAWGTHGSNESEATSTASRYSGYVRSGQATTENVISATGTMRTDLVKLRDPMFSIDDPVIYLSEWCKMDWGRPGADTIAERVRRRVEPNLKDYFMGEVYHAAPVSGNTAASYHDAAKTGYTPSGTKWKRMDWRGLIDNPELE